MTEAMDDPVIVGIVTTAFGVGGWVKVASFTEPPERLFAYQPWWLKVQDGWKPYELQKWRSHGAVWVAKLESVNDRNAAEALRKSQIAIAVEQLDELEDGEFYWRDLMGCRVTNLANEDLGTVKHLMETGANDVLVLTIDGQATPMHNSKGLPMRERLIPYIPDQVVREVDLENKVIRVDWPSDF